MGFDVALGVYHFYCPSRGAVKFLGRLTTIQPGWLQDPRNKAWRKMPQCWPALPTSPQLHPALLVLLLRRETPVSLLAVISMTRAGIYPWVQAKRKKMPVCCCCSMSIVKEPSTPPCTLPVVALLPKILSGLRAASPSRLGCHRSLCLCSADWTESGRLCSGKNDVKVVKQRVLCLAYLAKNYAPRKNSTEVE